MYSGTTFRTKSGRVMGAHQKIDRVAYRHVKRLVSRDLPFPTIREILHFEGLNGPDGIKRKSPAKDEPWHYIDPTNPDDRALYDMITDHIHNMAAALRTGNRERASFEAAWLAHAVVDGLTPAHHYPLEAKLEELRGGQGLETRTTTKDKLILPGKNRRHQIKNNWEYWGAKGVFTTHLSFELGIASTIAPLKFDNAALSDAQIAHLETVGFVQVFSEILDTIVAMDLYTEFARFGWTRSLAHRIRDRLVPLIIQAVALSWYQAIYDARGQG